MSEGLFSITINEEGCGDVSLIFFICSLNLNGTCSKRADVVSEVSDKDEAEAVKDGSKSNGSKIKSCTSGIGESSNTIEGVVGMEGVVEEGIESPVDNSCSSLFLLFFFSR